MTEEKIREIYAQTYGFRAKSDDIQFACAIASAARADALEEAASVAESHMLFDTTTGQLIAKEIRAKIEEGFDTDMIDAVVSRTSQCNRSGG